MIAPLLFAKWYLFRQTVYLELYKSAEMHPIYSGSIASFPKNTRRKLSMMAGQDSRKRPI
jgi:hypothetical protein